MPSCPCSKPGNSSPTSITGLLQTSLSDSAKLQAPLDLLPELIRLLRLSHQHRRFLHATPSLRHPVTPHPVTSQPPPRRYIHPSVSDEKAKELIESLQDNFPEEQLRQFDTVNEQRTTDN